MIWSDEESESAIAILVHDVFGTPSLSPENQNQQTTETSFQSESSTLETVISISSAIKGYTPRKSFARARERFKKTLIMRQVRVPISSMRSHHRNAENLSPLNTILDSGSSHHICKDEKMFTNIVHRDPTRVNRK